MQKIPMRQRPFLFQIQFLLYNRNQLVSNTILDTQMTEQQMDQIRQTRRLAAQGIYQAHSLTINNKKVYKNSNCPKNSEKNRKSAKREENELSEQNGLQLLQLLSQGRTVAQIRAECLPFVKYELKKLHNLYRCTLLKLSKAWLSVLPRQMCLLTVPVFQKTYFKSPNMLTHYFSEGLDLNQLFEKLNFLKNWRRQYDWYLQRGYGQDYLPQEIVNVLGDLPQYYNYMIQLYDKSPFRDKNEKKELKSKMRTNSTYSQSQLYEAEEESRLR